MDCFHASSQQRGSSLVSSIDEDGETEKFSDLPGLTAHNWRPLNPFTSVTSLMLSSGQEPTGNLGRMEG